MNNGKTSIKSYIIIGVVVLLALVAYFYYKGTQAPAQETLGIDAANNDMVGERVFALLGQMNALRIDKEFFMGQAYLTLRDYSVGIPTLPVGRTNPFAPLPGLTIKAK